MIECPNEQVVADVIQVTPVLQPRPCRADVFRCALALRLDQHTRVADILACTGEGGEEEEGYNKPVRSSLITFQSMKQAF